MSQHLSPRITGHCRREGRKIMKSRRGWTSIEKLCQTRQCCCTHGLTAAVTACTGPTLDQANPNPSTEWEGTHETTCYLESHRQLMSTGRGKVRFLWACGLWEATHVPLDSPVPLHIQAALCGVSWSEKGQTQEVGKEQSGEERRKIGEEGKDLNAWNS